MLLRPLLTAGDVITVGGRLVVCTPRVSKASARSVLSRLTAGIGDDDHGHWLDTLIARALLSVGAAAPGNFYTPTEMWERVPLTVDQILMCGGTCDIAGCDHVPHCLASGMRIDDMMLCRYHRDTRRVKAYHVMVP